MDENSAGLGVKVKQECCTEVSIDQGRDGLQGVDQISQSSYSAFINLAHKVVALKQEDDATETPLALGFAVVDVNEVQSLEPSQSPEVDPLQLSSPPIKYETPLGLRETLFIDIKRESESQGLPGDTEFAQWRADEIHLDPLSSIHLKCEGQDLEAETDVMSHMDSEGKDSAVFCEGRPRSRNKGQGRSSPEGDSTGHMTTLRGAEQFKHDTSREKVSVIEVPAKHNKPTRAKPFTCEICEAMLSWKSELIRHIRTHTGVKPFACDTCKSCFSRKSHLITHVRIHMGVKPHTCDTCQARFSLKSTLMTHMRTHTGVKPYPCDTCQAKFSHKSTLMVHMKTHTGLKPHICDTCQARFFSKVHSYGTHENTYRGEALRL